VLKGEDWFQDIPEDWASGSVKHLFDIQLGKMLQSERQSPSDRLVKYLKAQHVQWHCVTTTDLPEMWASPKELSQYSVQNGDLLVCEGGEAGRGAVVQGLEEEAIIQNALHRVRSNKNHARFLEYVLRSVHTSGWFDVLCNKSTIAHFTVEKFGAMRIPFPPLKTQKLIATFLDRKTAAIDILIAKKQRLIQLLEEKRTALINQAATKGLNPNVSMKSTGVEWLEEVPTHWDVMAIKYLAHSGRKTFIDGDWVELPYITEEGIRLIQTGNVGIGNYREKGFKYIAEESFHKLNCTEVKPNDVLICRLDGPVGRACLAPNLGLRMITSVDNTILKPATKHNARFIVYLLSCKSYLEWNQVLCRVGGGNRWRVSRSMLGDLRVPVPPEKEQKEIANFLEEKTAKILSTIDLLLGQIEKLQEYRRSLITAAVTGKLNIKEVETNV
jgi:type I restriction enzyme S subunit